MNANEKAIRDEKMIGVVKLMRNDGQEIVRAPDNPQSKTSVMPEVTEWLTSNITAEYEVLYVDVEVEVKADRGLLLSGGTEYHSTFFAVAFARKDDAFAFKMRFR